MTRDVDQLDLNLLRLFELVMREGGIARAGARLGLSQPAASNALKRLRTYCGDPLFVRTPRGLKPTPMASALLPTVSATLASLQGALEEYRAFDPARSARTFRILVIDVGELMFMPTLIAHLQRVAPGVRLVCRQLDRDLYAEALASGAADLALGELPPGQLDLVHQPLMDQPFVCLLGRDHPQVGERLSREEFLAAPHLSMTTAGVNIEMRMARALGKDMAQRRVVLQVQHYSVMPLVLAESGLLALVPQRVADIFEPMLGLRRVVAPYEIEPVHVSQFWHRRSQHDAGHRWLRQHIAEAYRA
jgi:DNA-binding transcriptional LysR family regulator